MGGAAGRPFRLDRNTVERPWGGEIWFTAPQPLPLLIKFIYTHQALSFQVHPGDDYAAQHHQSLGKTEMWHIVRAEPSARIALGWRETITRDRLRTASESGEIENLVNWVSPRSGDTFFTPAGTVHAIGAGIELWEIQENSDVTYRLFDYGRGRELHLDHALNVTKLEQSAATPVRLPVCSDWFCTDRVAFEKSYDLPPNPSRWEILIVMQGHGSIADQAFESGEVWVVPASSDALQLRSNDSCELLRSWVPQP